LATTGNFSPPAETWTKGFNDSWKRRRLKPLRLLGGPQLQARFLALSEDFWPVEPPSLRDFLTLYLSEGRGDLNQRLFCEFLRGLLPEKRLSKSEAQRRIAAVNLFSSYLHHSFERNKDHWSLFCGWTIVAAHERWFAEVQHLSSATWRSSISLAKSAAHAALTNLTKEALTEKALLPQGTELDDYTRIRNTVTAAAIAAWHLIEWRNSRPTPDAGAAHAKIHRLCERDRLLFWGESALPHCLSISLFLERRGLSTLSEDLLLRILAALASRNRQTTSGEGILGADISPDDALLSILKRLKEKPKDLGKKAKRSAAAEPLVHLLARRLRRQALSSLWSDLTDVGLASFLPDRPHDILLWHCSEGKEHTGKFKRPQSWRDLCEDAAKRGPDNLPSALIEDPDFALSFALAYPHRLNVDLVGALDNWFS
jgi:hypothetical protein